MKKIVMKKITSTILALLLLATATPFSSALSAEPSTITEGLPLLQIALGVQNDLWNNFAFQKTASSIKGETITSFDVSDQMGILVITSGNHLLHMDQSGRTIGVFHFDCAGTVGVAWDSSDICLFFTRGHILAKVNCDGELIEISKLSQLNYMTQKKWNALAFRSKKEIGSRIYELQQIGIQPYREYSKLVCVDTSTGSEQSILDVSRETVAKSITTVIIWIAFLVIVIIIVKNRKRQRNS